MKWTNTAEEPFVSFWRRAAEEKDWFYVIYHYAEDEQGWYEKLLMCSTDVQDIDDKERELKNRGIHRRHILRYYVPGGDDFIEEFRRFKTIKPDDYV